MHVTAFKLVARVFCCFSAAVLIFAVVLPYCLLSSDCSIVDTYNVATVLPTPGAPYNCTLVGNVDRASSQQINLTLVDSADCPAYRPGSRFPVCYSFFGKSQIQRNLFISTSPYLVIFGPIACISTGLSLIALGVTLLL